MLLLLYAIAGGTCGMLINYFSDVLPTAHRLTPPMCQNCHEPYPLADYLSFQRCPHCGNAQSIRWKSVIISGFAIGVLLYFFPVPTLSFWATLPLFIYLGVVSVVDIEHRVVLLETSIAGFIICLVLSFILHGFKVTLFGALGGFAVMFLFYLLGIVFNLVMGRIKHQKIDEVAFGFGDVSLGTILGLLVGWPAILGLIIIAIAAFGVFSSFFILRLLLLKQYRVFTSALPFAPFLVLGVLILLYL